MDFKIYQKEARKTAIYKDKGKNYIYPVLGLCGESGEVAEKIKKIIRDGDGTISKEQKVELEKELGDILWYIANLGIELGLKLDNIATKNIDKLKSRQTRGVLRGSGDNR